MKFILFSLFSVTVLLLLVTMGLSSKRTKYQYVQSLWMVSFILTRDNLTKTQISLEGIHSHLLTPKQERKQNRNDDEDYDDDNSINDNKLLY